MLCCGGNAMWTLGKLVANAAAADADAITVNLHLSVDTPVASIINWEPFEGRLELVPRRDGKVRIRKPAYASAVKARIDGGEVPPRPDGEYLVFDSVRSGDRIQLTYGLPVRTTVETPHEGSHLEGTYGPKSDPIVKERIQATWRGNTVLAIDCDEESEHPAEHRLYLDRMERYQRGEGRESTEENPDNAASGAALGPGDDDAFHDIISLPAPVPRHLRRESSTSNQSGTQRSSSP